MITKQFVIFPRSAMVAVLMFCGCAVNPQPSLSQRLMEQEQLHRSRMAFVEKEDARIAQLPPEERNAARERLMAIIQRWITEDEARVRALDREQAIQSQQDVADAINDLTDELRQERMWQIGH